MRRLRIFLIGTWLASRRYLRDRVGSRITYQYNSVLQFRAERDYLPSRSDKCNQFVTFSIHSSSSYGIDFTSSLSANCSRLRWIPSSLRPARRGIVCATDRHYAVVMRHWLAYTPYWKPKKRATARFVKGPSRLRVRSDVGRKDA